MGHLASVERLRQQQRLEPAFAAQVAAVKAYQHERFRGTYVDMLTDARHAPAARFFLDELYGPHDFSRRDAQFTRIVPKLVVLFPEPVVRTVRDLARLHDLSETLDCAMARQLASAVLDEPTYARAWRQVGMANERSQQIALAVGIGRDLEGFTRTPLLLTSLKLMRGPARAAGLSDLQHFLESGVAAFRHMGGSRHFLNEIERREQALAQQLFAAQPDSESAAITSPAPAAQPGTASGAPSRSDGATGAV